MISLSSYSLGLQILSRCLKIKHRDPQSEKVEPYSRDWIPYISKQAKAAKYPTRRVECFLFIDDYSNYLDLWNHGFYMFLRISTVRKSET